MADLRKPVKLELSVDTFLTLLLFLYPYGADQMNLPHSFWIGLGCWMLGAAVAVRLLWIILTWAHPFTKLERVLFAAIFVGVLVVCFYRPVATAYESRRLRQEHRSQNQVASTKTSQPASSQTTKPLSSPPAPKTKPKKNAKPSEGAVASSSGTNSGAARSITQGPGSIAQVGGSNNTAVIEQPAGWMLTRPQQIELQNALTGIHGRVRFGWWAQDPGSVRYAGALAYAFKEAGWKIENQVPGYLGSVCWPSADWDCIGLQVVVRDRSGKAASIAIAALSPLVPHLQIDTSEKNDEDLVDVFVSKSPQ
jgi:hypothetical protein